MKKKIESTKAIKYSFLINWYHKGNIDRKKYKGRGRPKKTDYYIGLIASKGI